MAQIRNQIRPNTPIEIWFQDEARIGQKTKITRRWAKRGTRPVAPKDQRTRSAWIYGAICPARGVGAALVLPICNTKGMNLHLLEISANVALEAHAIIIVDQAGWHFSKDLEIPDNLTLPTAAITGTQSGRKRLAVHARQLALKQDLQILQRHHRSQLLRVEPTDRSALADHVHWITKVGASVILYAGWLSNSSFQVNPY